MNDGSGKYLNLDIIAEELNMEESVVGIEAVPTNGSLKIALEITIF